MLWSKSSYKNPALFLAFFTCLFFSHKLALGADDYVAKVSQVDGAVTIERDSKTIIAAKGVRLKNEDSISTGTDGAIGILFNDETTLSLGPVSKLTIDEYVFDPDRSNFAFVVHLFKGTAAYMSGLIAKLSSDSVSFITPSASIGVRGTKFVIEVKPL